MVLLLLLLVVGLYGLSRILPGLWAPETPVETPVAEVPETPPAPVFSLPDFILPDQPVRVQAMETLPARIDTQGLVKGQNHSLEAGRYAYDTAQVKRWMRGEEPYEGEKIAFLTFDDGPNRNTVRVLDILKERGVPGTFFLLGRTLENYADPDIMHRYIREGHAIAVHSYSHDYGYLYPGRNARPDRVVEEYNRSIQVMQDILGPEFYSSVFRFPGGAMSWRNIPAAQEALAGIQAVDIDWNAMSGDAEPTARRPSSPEAMARYAITTLEWNRNQDVAVVLMHDAVGTTPEYLDKLIDLYEERGFVFGILK